MNQSRTHQAVPHRPLASVSTAMMATVLWTAILSGCSWISGDDPAPDPNAPPVTLLYSPNGEPLNGGPLGKPTCRDALGHWFDRLASPPDHVITNAAFLADARTQFRRMDIDGNGYLLPEELDRFRLPYRQPLPPRHSHHSDAQTTGDTDSGETHHHRSSGGSNHGATEEHSNPAGSQPDPVMAADTGLTSKVTLDAFLIQANTSFARLDSAHNGRLTEAEVLSLCDPRK